MSAYGPLNSLSDFADEMGWQRREIHRQLAGKARVRDVVDGGGAGCERCERRLDVVGNDGFRLEAAGQSTRFSDAPRVERDLSP